MVHQLLYFSLFMLMDNSHNTRRKNSISCMAFLTFWLMLETWRVSWPTARA
jgi:hypothetical protein